MILQLPTDRPRSESREFRGAYVPIDLPKDLLEGFKSLSSRQDTTLFMVLLASFQALLSHLTGQQAISVGTDIANRNRRETENLIGFFINQLVLRTDLSANPTFTELLGRVREVTLSAYAHQDVPFELLVDALKPERSLKYAPLFQVKLVLQNTPQGALDLPGLTLSLLKVGYVAAKFDLTLILSETPDGLTGNFEYDTDLFDESTISRIAKLYVALLGKVITEPDIRLEELKEYLAEIERKQQAMEKTEREGRQRQKLMGIKPKKLRAAQESLVKKEFRHPSETFPLVVKPLSEETDLVGWVKSNRQAVELDLQKHGALLFRGFSIDLMTEFEFFAGALCTELFDENGEHPRNVVSGKVYTPVFYPADQHLLWHNENSFNYRWPTKIFFACMLPAQHGGETPIADSRQVFDRINPTIRERFIQKGVMYVRNYDAALGLDWQAVFQTTDKSEVERSCRAAGMEFQWKDNGQLRTRAVRPAVIPHPVTGEMSWFNQAQHWHVSCLDPATRESIVSVFREEDYPRHCYYGDGSTIPDAAMMEILDVYRRIEVSFTWQAKDIMMLDNILMAHARNQFSGERKLLVAMGDMMSFADIEARRAALA
jgi:alpha-ketoglutarate-dependent taurine dioxygenase